MKAAVHQQPRYHLHGAARAAPGDGPAQGERNPNQGQGVDDQGELNEATPGRLIWRRIEGAAAGADDVDKWFKDIGEGTSDVRHQL